MSDLDKLESLENKLATMGQTPVVKAHSESDTAVWKSSDLAPDFDTQVKDIEAGVRAEFNLSPHGRIGHTGGAQPELDEAYTAYMDRIGKLKANYEANSPKTTASDRIADLERQMIQDAVNRVSLTDGQKQSFAQLKIEYANRVQTPEQAIDELRNLGRNVEERQDGIYLDGQLIAAKTRTWINGGTQQGYVINDHDKHALMAAATRALFDDLQRQENEMLIEAQNASIKRMTTGIRRGELNAWEASEARKVEVVERLAGLSPEKLERLLEMAGE